MSKRPTNDRVVDPDRDDRLRLVAECIERAGYPAVLAPILAEGFVARLRRRIYAALNDVIGTGDDLEALAGWTGPTRALAAVMHRAGYVKEINGVYVMVDALNEAPEYLKKRWQRNNRVAYDEAVKRSGRPNIVNQPYGVPGDDDDYDYDGEMKKEEDMQDSQGNLFAPEPERLDEKHVATTPGLSECWTVWLKLYKQRYTFDYIRRGRCQRHMRDILAAIGSVGLFERCAKAYLADQFSKYAGHELRHFWQDLARFRAAADQQHRQRTGRNASIIRTDAGRG